MWEPERHSKRRSWAGWSVPARLLGLMVGLAALIWFLIRVIPKPSRAAYPCQRVAFPLASGFVIWVVGAIGSITAFRRARSHSLRSRRVAAMGCLALAVACIWLAQSATMESPLVADPVPNAPIGIARGVNPGRVVWVHDPDATNWAGPGMGDGYWWQPAHTDQAAVSNMLSVAVRRLAGTQDDAAAWDAIIRNFNQAAGKGDAGYQPGEKVAIKVNFSTCNRRLSSVDPATYDKTNYIDKIDTSPQMIVALLRQLVYAVGVAQADISVGDTVTFFPNHFYNICHAEFPDVRYFDCYGGFGRVKVEYSDVVQHWSGAGGGFPTDYLPTCFAQADYIINLPCLKGHAAGITLCAKNHYGSYIRLPDEDGYYKLHGSLAHEDGVSGHYRALVDIMGHPRLGGRTLLNIVDGLYGGYRWEGTAYKFAMDPFNGDWPSSVFVSQDQVAIDSVGLDFLWQEWPGVVRIAAVDDYLHEAAQADDPPSGVLYDPNGAGSGIASLGVHEHWDNAISRKYSRNLGAGDGIELVAVRIGASPGDISRDGAVDSLDLRILAQQWLDVPGEPSADIAPAPAGDGAVNFLDFAAMASDYQP